MIARLRTWRRTPAAIWAEWFAIAGLAISLALAGYALGWHWAIVGFLGINAALICALVALLWSIRGELDEEAK